MTSFEQVDPRSLRAHPENTAIYGEGEVADLVARIRETGWIKPLIVTSDGVIVSGHRRHRAVLALGLERVPVERRVFADGAALLEALLLENQYRDKTPEQRVREAERWAGIERERAAQRRLATQNNQTARAVPPNLADLGGAREARSAIAERVGLKHSTYEKAAEVVRLADRLAATEPEHAHALLAILNTQSVDAAVKVARDEDRAGIIAKLATGEAKTVPQAKRLVIADAIRAEPEPLPAGPFRVIVADPPWPYEKRAEDITHRARLPYPDMTIADICALDVAGLAHDDAVLWLWTTNAHMPDAYRVLSAWGFTHKTILTWVKNRMGTGDWLRGQTEHCLLAVRGRPAVVLTNQTTVLYGDVREHSRKPEGFYGLVEALCPGSKVEMFARQGRTGWHTWGGEREKFDDDHE